MNQYVAIARIPAYGLEAFLAYESAVLPLLPDHGGTLDRRLRSQDGTTEIHVISFATDTGLASYRQDPRRTAAADLLTESGATVELLPMVDLPAQP